MAMLLAPLVNLYYEVVMKISRINQGSVLKNSYLAHLIRLREVELFNALPYGHTFKYYLNHKRHDLSALSYFSANDFK